MGRRIAALLVAVAVAAPATAWALPGLYLHTSTDPAYFQNGEVVQDPYGVGEGAGAANEGNHVAYEGPVDVVVDDVVVAVDDHYALEQIGWPYDRTRVVLAAAFPCIPDRFCFDHDAAAQLLAAGMGWPNLHALYEKR